MEGFLYFFSFFLLLVASVDKFRATLDRSICNNKKGRRYVCKIKISAPKKSFLCICNVVCLCKRVIKCLLEPNKLKNLILHQYFIVDIELIYAKIIAVLDTVH